ncbi:probable beta-1,4-xylosyltransferase IRX9H [Coffea eugenioides]|uniref:probable beta-1,4-xylosyltransferase IRX9H n=1 Tax=Coffea eugenioides TaxID=49369 RepID=UPI000F60B87C|nr:probable beta-1,4-xylosyltransferase IRX9H [Coffea eugenioides]
MASFRRSLSVVPQHGSSADEEEYAVASSLPKSPSVNSDHLPTGGLFLRSFSSLDYALYKLQTLLILGLFPKRSSRPLERFKSKGNSWRRALLHFLVCFLIGILIEITPFASPTFSTNLLAKHQPFSLEMLQQVNTVRFYQHDDPKNFTSAVEGVDINDDDKPKSEDATDEREDGIPVGDQLTDKTLYEDINTFNKLLIIVTPIYSRPFQAYYLNRLAQTLGMVPPPLLWIVVEMTSQSAETAEILRNSGVMHRHLICKETLTGTNDRGMLLRNVGLSHIETHQLDGIIYFADDDNMYTTDLFDQMRHIRRFGTWIVAELVGKNTHAVMEGPICNGSQVMGWHLNERSNKFQKFRSGLSGFAFNSTLLWDPKRWHRRPLQPIRLLDSVKEAPSPVSRFIEQIAEGENEMECLPLACSRAMVWRLDGEFLYSFPHENSTRSSLILHWLNGVLDFAIIKNLIH